MIMSIDVPMGQKRFKVDIRGFKLGVCFTDNLKKSGIFTLNLNMEISKSVPTGKKRVIGVVRGFKLGVSLIIC